MGSITTINLSNFKGRNIGIQINLRLTRIQKWNPNAQGHFYDVYEINQIIYVNPTILR